MAGQPGPAGRAPHPLGSNAELELQVLQSCHLTPTPPAAALPAGTGTMPGRGRGAGRARQAGEAGERAGEGDETRPHTAARPSLAGVLWRPLAGQMVALHQTLFCTLPAPVALQLKNCITIITMQFSATLIFFKINF